MICFSTPVRNLTDIFQAIITDGDGRVKRSQKVLSNLNDDVVLLIL